MDENAELILWALGISASVVLLAGWLMWSAWVVYHDLKVAALSGDQESVGKALETQSIIGSIQEVRSDHTKACATKPTPTPRHNEHLAMARAKVEGRSYFQKVHSNPQELQQDLNQI